MKKGELANPIKIFRPSFRVKLAFFVVTIVSLEHSAVTLTHLRGRARYLSGVASGEDGFLTRRESLGKNDVQHQFY